MSIRKDSRVFRKKLLAACCGLLASTGADANPQGPSIVAGQVGFANPGPKMLQITNSPGAIINWNSFSIGADEVTRFVQQNAASAVLNRVTGNTSSALLGQLSSNGRVFLINPTGILVGRDAVLNTAGLVLSTLNMSDDDFGKGVLKFKDGGSAGAITNHGYIKTAPGGETILIAPSITNAPEDGNANSGIIENPDGRLLLAAGHSISITSLDHPDITFDVSAPDGDVLNLGKLIVNGGMAGVLAGTIKHQGMISADSVTLDAAGRVVLMATKSIETTPESTITAHNTGGGAGGAVEITARAPAPAAVDGASAPATTTLSPTPPVVTEVHQAGAIDVTGSQGGSAHVEADKLAVAGSIDASGTSGGGSVAVLGTDITTTGAKLAANATNGSAGAVRVGGDFHGAAGTRTADTTTIDAATELHADAGDVGNGGSVVVWSEHTTEFLGLASARGGNNAGNGGSLEISGKDLLSFRGTADVGAPQGTPGSLLLDPARIIIVPGGTTNALVDPTPFPNDHFGTWTYFSVLANGNLLYANQNAGNTGVTAAGEIYMYDPNGNYLGGVAGTAQNERLGSWGLVNVGNGNLLARDPGATVGGAANAGAAILLSGTTGNELGRVSGNTANEQFGTQVRFSVGPSANYVIESAGNSGGAGTVVLTSSTSGKEIGRVSGATAGDSFGSWVDFGIGANANYLIRAVSATVGGQPSAGTVVLVSSTTGLELGRVSGNTTGESFGSNLRYGIGANGNILVQAPGETVGGQAGAGTVVLINSATGVEIGRVSGTTAGENFGNLVDYFVVAGGNFVVRSPFEDIGGQAAAGTVVLVNANTGTEIGRVSGNTANENFGNLVDYFVVPGGNYVVRSPSEDVSGQAAAGTVVLVNGSTGTEIGRVSGNTANENFGSTVQYSVGPNSNYVIESPLEDVAGQAAAGVVVMASSTTGLELGRVSGTTANEQLGSLVDYAVGAGSNYVIRSAAETVGSNLNAGAVILASGTTGAELGRVSGGSAGARFGDFVDYSDVPSGTYLVRSPTADVGGNRAAGTAVLVSDSTGAEIGRTDGLSAGDALGTYAPNMRSSGNYVLRVPNATAGGIAGAGSVVLVDGTTGTRLSSFDGDTLNEHLGLYDLAINGFPAGNSVVDFNVLGGAEFLVYSPLHGSGAGIIAQILDAPFNGSIFHGGVSGVTISDGVGSEQVFVPPGGNGNYIVSAQNYANGTVPLAGPLAGAGAMFVMDVTTASPIATIQGNAVNEHLGSGVDYNLFSTYCCSSEFAIRSASHGSVFGAADNAGAVFFVDAISGSVNSLVGNPGDRLGQSAMQLFGGNVILPVPLASPGGVSAAGSLYVLNSTNAAVIGRVDGVTVNEGLGSTLDFSSLGSATKFLVDVPNRTVGGNVNAGAVLLVDATTGTQLGGVFGTSAAEQLGLSGNGIWTLSNGNYLVGSRKADTAGGIDAGSLILASGVDGNEIGRLDGLTPNEQLGYTNFTQVFVRSNGNYFASSTVASPGGLLNAGTVYLGNGATGAMIGKADGTTAGETFGNSINYFLLPSDDILVFNQFHTTAAGANAGTMVQLAAVDLGGGNIIRGRIDGQSANERLGSNGPYSTAFMLSSGNLIVRSLQASPGGNASAGTLYFYNPTSGSLLGQVNGSTANEQLGSSGWIQRANGNLFIPSPLASPNGVSGAGSLILATGSGATIGRVDGNHASEAFGSNVDYFSIPNNALVLSSLHDNGAATGAGGLFMVADSDLGGGNILRAQLLGTAVNEHLSAFSRYTQSNGNFLLPSPDATIGGLASAGTVMLVNGSTLAILGRTDGNTANERFGSDIRRYWNTTNSAYDYFVVSPLENVGVLTAAGAIVQIDPLTGAARQRITGISANEQLGSDPGGNGWHPIGNGRILVPSINAAINGIAGAGRIVMIDQNGGTGSGSSFGGVGSNVLFGTLPGNDFVITNEQIEAILATGASLVLQANNDIISLVGADIAAKAGALTLQAGRSIELGSVIDVPTLKLVAHESAANGVLTQYTGTGSGDLVLDAASITAHQLDASGENIAFTTSGLSGGTASLTASTAMSFVSSTVRTTALRLTAPTLSVQASQIVAGTLAVDSQDVSIQASQDPLATALPIVVASPDFFLDYLGRASTDVGGAAFMLGGDLLEMKADNRLALLAGPAAGAFAALASVGDFNVNTDTLELTAGSGANADAVLLGLAGRANINYRTCTNCTILEFDPFLQNKSETGIYLNVVRSPAIDAILSMLGKEQGKDEESERKKKEKDKDKETKDSQECTI